MNLISGTAIAPSTKTRYECILHQASRPSDMGQCCRSLSQNCLVNTDTTSGHLLRCCYEFGMQVSPARPGTNVRTRVLSALTTARSENSSSVVNQPAPSSAPSGSTLFVLVVETPNTVPSVLSLVTLRGRVSTQRGKRGLSVS